MMKRDVTRQTPAPHAGVAEREERLLTAKGAARGVPPRLFVLVLFGLHQVYTLRQAAALPDSLELMGQRLDPPHGLDLPQTAPAPFAPGGGEARTCRRRLINCLNKALTKWSDGSNLASNCMW